MGEERCDGGEKHRNKERNYQDRSTNIEEGVGKGCLPCRRRTIECGEPRRHRRADVHPEYSGRRRLETQHPLLRKRDDDCRHRGGRLHHGSKHERKENTLCESPRRSRVQRLEDFHDFRHDLRRSCALLHPVETHENASKTHEHEADVVQPLAPLEEVECRAHTDDEQSEHIHVRRKGNEPCRGRRADVRADDHVDRLCEVQEARRYEPHDHHCDDRRRLDNHGRDDARPHSRQAMRRRKRHEPPQARPAHGLQPFGEMLHAEQERTQPTADYNQY